MVAQLGGAEPPGRGGALARRFANIVTYLRHRVTNATSESLNAWVKYTARGFRNKQNFVNAIYFHLNLFCPKFFTYKEGFGFVFLGGALAPLFR